jgi:exonuclease III
MFSVEIAAEAACVAHDTEDAWTLSDHCPVIVDFELALD